MQKTKPPFNGHVHSVRKAGGDVDGLCAKFVIDGICRYEGTILEDDSPAFLKEIRYTQEKGAHEKTVITFT